MLTAILTALAAIHIYWAAGGRSGIEASIPKTSSNKPLFQPGPLGALAVALLLLIAATIPFAPISPKFRTLLLRAMAMIFTLRAIGEFRYVGFFKKINDTPFAYWDTRLFTPLCLLIALLAVLSS